MGPKGSPAEGEDAHGRGGDRQRRWPQLGKSDPVIHGIGGRHYLGGPLSATLDFAALASPPTTPWVFPLDRWARLTMALSRPRGPR